MSKTLLGFRDGDMYIHHTVTENPDKDDYSFKSHSHNMVEIYLFLQGNAHFAIDGRIFDLKRGTLAVMYPGQTHNLLIEECQKYERIAFLIDPCVLPEEYALISEKLKKGENIYTLTVEEVDWLIKSIYIPSSLRQSAKKRMYLSLVSFVFCMLYSKKTGSDETVGIMTDETVRLTAEYINEHLGDNALSLNGISSALFINKTALNRKFRAVMGCSVWDYVIRKRIYSAQQHLIFTGNIGATFEASGFSDYSAFWRAYKKIIGISPKEDLKKHSSKM